jgi:methoxymalonate biosynthesis acyl carrier protein
MTNDTQSLETRIITLFSDALQMEIPSPDTDLLATGRLDSLGIVELLMQLEKTFGITIELEDLELDHFRSVNAIVRFVASRAHTGIAA